MPTRPGHALRILLLTVLLVATVVTPATAATGGDPFEGSDWFVDPASNAAREADRLRPTDPTRAALFDRIAAHPQADWFGDWTPTADVTEAVARRTASIRHAGALPLYVTYAIPLRDCGGYSAGGVASPAGYRDWVDAFAAGLDGGRAIVIVEPDALAMLDCLDTTERGDRVALLRYAVDTLAAAGASVYLDAGHSGWHPAATMADRLVDAGVAQARGFALNVSNFRWTEGEVAYARDLSARTGGTRAVIDTSRNGRGPSAAGAWCNPDGRGLGPVPSAETTDPVVDAHLWVKRPGESDGTCNGGPSAGTWWPAYAQGLAARAVVPPDPDAPDSPDAPDAPRGGRVAGPDRVATAVAVAATGWDRAATVVLARSDDPADALAGTGLAGRLDAPLLVTPPTTLDPRVAAEIQRLSAHEVVVLGGAAAVAEPVVAALRETGATVRRIAGTTRTTTATAIAHASTDRAATALLVHERSWPDALAVAGLAARRAASGDAWPVLLADDGVTAATRATLDRLRVDHVVVVGGTAVLPAGIDAELRATGRTVERLAGATRHDTSLAAATRDLSMHGHGPLLLATSAGFADGLAAGAYAARVGGTVLLVPPALPDPGQLAWARQEAGHLVATVAIGGAAAISDDVHRAMRGA